MAGTGFGLKPLRKFDGSAYNGAVTRARVANSNSIMYIGTAIATTTDGRVDQVATTAEIRGVAMGFEWTDANGYIHKDNYIPASTATASIAAYVTYVEGRNIIFELMDASGTLTEEEIGLNYDTASNSAGSTTTGLSTAKLGTAGASSGVLTAQLRILALVDEPGNTITSTSSGSRFEVGINETEFGGEDALGSGI